MSRNPPKIPSNGRGGKHEPGVFVERRPRRMFEIEAGQEEGLWRERRGRRPWPGIPRFLRGTGRADETGWSGWDGEGWRRGVGRMESVSGCGIVGGTMIGGGTGDVVVWCLYPERAHVDEEGKKHDGGRVREEAEKLKEKLKVGVAKGTGGVK